MLCNNGNNNEDQIKKNKIFEHLYGIPDNAELSLKMYRFCNKAREIYIHLLEIAGEGDPAKLLGRKR